MKKVFSSFVVAVFGVTMIAAGALMLGLPGTVSAGEITAVATGGDDAAAVPTVYAQEMVNAALTTGVPGNLISIELTGLETLAIAVGYTIRFDLPAGTTFQSTTANYNLALATAGLGVLANVTRTRGGQDETFVEFSFDVTIAALVALDNLTLTNADANGLRISNDTLSTAGAAIPITVAVRDPGNISQTSASLAFMSSTYGIEIVTNSPANGLGQAIVIDCPTGRMQFLIGGVNQTYANNATINPRYTTAVQGDGATAFVLVAADSLTVTMLGDMTGINQIWLDTTPNGVVDAGEPVATIAANVATFPVINGNSPLIAGNPAVGISVDGTTVLEDRNFTVATSLNMVDIQFNDNPDMTIRRGNTLIAAGVVTLGAAADGIYSWAHNCYAATTPYINQSATYLTFMKFYNNSTLDASVIVDATPDDGTGAVTNQTLSQTIPAGTVGFFRASDIATELGITAEAFAMRFIITAPANQVFGTVVQKSAIGQRVLPLYSNGANY